MLLNLCMAPDRRLPSIVFGALHAAVILAPASCTEHEPSVPIGSGAVLSRVVTSAGGTLELEGVTLTIPPGVLSHDQAITIESTQEAAPGDHDARSPVYRFLPEGLVFDPPAVIQMSFDGPAEDVGVYWSSGSQPGFEWIGGEIGAGHVTARVSHFSRGFVGRLRAQSFSMSVQPSVLLLAKGRSAQLRAVATFPGGVPSDVTFNARWSSTNPEVASVSDSGFVSGNETGTTRIAASFAGERGEAEITVTAAELDQLRIFPRNVADGTSNTILLMEIYRPLELRALGGDSDGGERDLTEDALWSSSQPEIAAVTGPGTLMLLDVGTATISARVGQVEGSARVTGLCDRPSELEIRCTRQAPCERAPRGYTIEISAVLRCEEGSPDVTPLARWRSSDPSLADIGVPGSIEALEAGDVDIIVELGRFQARKRITVTPAVLESIEVVPSDTEVHVGLSTDLEAIGRYSDGTSANLTRSVAWTSSDPEVASVSTGTTSYGRATGISEGTVMVTAALGSITGTARVRVIEAALERISITPENPSVPVGVEQQFYAYAHYSDGRAVDVTLMAVWIGQPFDVIEILGPGRFRGAAQGAATVRASLTTLSPFSATTQVTFVAPIILSLSIAPTTASVDSGNTVQLALGALFSDQSQSDVTSLAAWSSSDDSVATVSGSGLVQGIAPGSAIITAILGGRSVSAAISVVEPVLIGIRVAPGNSSVAEGLGVQFSAEGEYSNGSRRDVTLLATWSTSDPGIASAAAGGTVTGIAPGMAIVFASLGGVSGTATITVTDPIVVSVRISPGAAELPLGSGVALSAAAHHSNGVIAPFVTALWGSSDQSVASVSPGGFVSSHAIGTAEISATYQGVTGRATITVGPPAITSIDVAPTNASIPSGRTQQMTATGVYSTGARQDVTLQVTWSSSNSSIATVSNTSGAEGLAAGVSVGIATISATLPGGASGSTSLTVTPAELVSITIAPSNPSVDAGFTLQLSAWGGYSDGSTADITSQVTWSSSDSTVATVSNGSSRGVANGLREGSATISATFGSIAGTTTLTVGPPILQSISISPATPSAMSGTTLQLSATGAYSDGTSADITTQVTWSSSNLAVATISNTSGSEGLVTAIAEGQTTITASLAGVNGTATLAVTPGGGGR